MLHLTGCLQAAALVVNSPDYAIDWGDGAVTTQNSTTHTYTAPGIFQMQGRIIIIIIIFIISNTRYQQ